MFLKQQNRTIIEKQKKLGKRALVERSQMLHTEYVKSVIKLPVLRESYISMHFPLMLPAGFDFRPGYGTVSLISTELQVFIYQNVLC